MLENTLTVHRFGVRTEIEANFSLARQQRKGDYMCWVINQSRLPTRRTRTNKVPSQEDPSIAEWAPCDPTELNERAMDCFQPQCSDFYKEVPHIWAVGYHSNRVHQAREFFARADHAEPAEEVVRIEYQQRER